MNRTPLGEATAVEAPEPLREAAPERPPDLEAFVLLALERFFRLALMVLDFGRVPNLT
jgi:hypothetical protein